MDRPEELIRRASQKGMRLPGVRPAAQDETMRMEAAEEPFPPPRPVSRHSSYTALMRSHDRVHTRHIKG